MNTAAMHKTNDMVQEEEEENPFMARVNAKRARNLEHLRSLGLGHSLRATENSKNKKRKKKPTTPIQPQRRSKRARNTPASYRESRLSAVVSPPSQRVRPSNQEQEYHLNGDDDASSDNGLDTFPPRSHDGGKKKNRAKTTARKTTDPTSLPLNSARRIAIDVERLLFGDEDKERQSSTASALEINKNDNEESTNNDDGNTISHGLLGKTLTQTGKAFCMQESARLASDFDTTMTDISFNKYSGVQEWGNDVLYLWVNLGGPQNEMVNEFQWQRNNNNKREMTMTWYGGSRMHEHSPVIQQLIRVGKQQQQQQQRGSEKTEDNETSSPTKSGAVLLWCRRYVNKAFTPYRCLGRVEYVSHEPESQPLAFVWKLVDYERVLSISKKNQNGNNDGNDGNNDNDKNESSKKTENRQQWDPNFLPHIVPSHPVAMRVLSGNSD